MAVGGSRASSSDLGFGLSETRKQNTLVAIGKLHVGDRVMYIGGTYSAKRYPEWYPGIGTVATVTLIDQAENPGTDIYVRWPAHGRPALLHPVKAVMLARA